jgi:uncharacterized protein YlaI
MPFSLALANLILTYPCPHCEHKLQKKGSYFQTVGHYYCTECQGRVNITYDDKVKLFDAHAHLARD